MATSKSITAKIARREAKLAELTTERDSLLAQAKAIETATGHYTFAVKKQQALNLRKEAIAVVGQLGKLHREIRALQSELASLS